MRSTVRTLVINLVPLFIILLLIEVFINGSFMKWVSSLRGLTIHRLHINLVSNLISNLFNQFINLIQPAHAIFLAILFESLPFILIGAFLSSLIHVLISEDQMIRLIPQNKILSVFVGSLIGFVVPVCDCGTMPVARTLLKKGVSLPTVVSFVLAAPVINPITLIATYFAFGMNLHIVVIRFVSTFGIAALVGLLTGRARQAMLLKARLETVATVTDRQGSKSRKTNAFKSIIEHTVEEFFGIIGFLICSAAIASVYQVYHTQHAHTLHAQPGVMSVLFLMGLAILFSLCSMADAFVARSFATIYPLGPVIAFMVIGQMVDLRNLFLLPKTFGGKRAVKMIAMSLVFCFILGMVI